MKSIPVWGAIILALIVGTLMALQSRINGELADRLDDPFTGTAFGFILANLILLIACAFWRPGRHGIARVLRAVRGGTMPLWMLSGGLVGAVYVLTQSLTVATLGVALFSVASVGGQAIGGAMMDRTRIVPGGPYTLTPARAAGALLAIIAVIVTQSTGFQSSVPVWMMLLPIAVGMAQGWQQAVNAQVRMEAHSAFTTTFFNGWIGLLLLIPAAAIKVAVSGVPADFPSQWWLYSGGMIGIIFIAIAPIVVHAMGALLYTLVAITGQLTAAVVLDLLRADAEPLPATTIIGVALALLAVGVGSLRRRPPFARGRRT